MAGLLGDTDWTDPANQGLLQFGLSMLAGSGPSTRRTSVGQLIGLAGGQGMDAFNVARRQKLLEQESRRRDELAQAQLQEILAQAEERKTKLAEQQRLQQVLSGALSPISQAEALTAGGGPTNAAADLVGKSRPLDPQRLLLQGVPTPIVDALMKAQDFGRPKVARTIEVDDGKGGKATVMVDDFGRPVGDKMPGYVPPQLANLGNEYRWVSPRDGQGYAVSMSPTEQDASRHRWATFAQSRQQANRPQYVDGVGFVSFGQDGTPNVLNVPGVSGRKPPADYQWGQDKTSLVPIPGGPADPSSKPLGAAETKQVIGARNLRDAIAEYKSQLKNWSNFSMLSPAQITKMGTLYNNMMLQAKEAYNLGVLNGPDYEILTQTVTNPMSMRGAVSSNDALAAQATQLDKISRGIEAQVYAAAGKKPPADLWSGSADETTSGLIDAIN